MVKTKTWVFRNEENERLYACNFCYDKRKRLIYGAVYPPLDCNASFSYAVDAVYTRFDRPKNTDVEIKVDSNLEAMIETIERAMATRHVSHDWANEVPANEKALWRDHKNFESWYHSISRHYGEDK